ncbi:MAG: iron ABC transporter permease [Bacteroidota bacterium]
MNPSQSSSTIASPPREGPGVGWFVALLGLLGSLFILDLAWGSVSIPFNEVLSWLTGQSTSEQGWDNILTYLRLPKACSAVLVGGALAVGGLMMQTLFRNPLAGPSVLGLTAGASLGVALVMLSSGAATSILAIQQLGIGGSSLMVLAASMGAGLVMGLILLMSFRIRDHVVLLILGIMLGFLTTAVVSIWQYFSSPEQIQDYLIWTFGSLGGQSPAQLQIMALVIGLALLLAFIQSKSLNLLLLGEAYARSMGLSVKPARAWIIALTSLLAGTVTGFCGPIGFIGIAVPHLARSLFQTADHRYLIPLNVLLGAVVMLACDLIASLPGSAVSLPINAVTALVGAPVVIWVILRRGNLGASF